MRLRTTQGGFVLLMTLALVLLAAVVLASVARRSILGAVEAQDALEELQRRWAMHSGQATMLDAAERLLHEAEIAQQKHTGHFYPVAQRRVHLALAGVDYEWVLTDEQAKLNVNRLLSGGDRAAAQAITSRVAAGQGGYGGTQTVDLRPAQLPTSNGLQNPALAPFGGLEQVFPLATPLELAGSEGRYGLAHNVTCWGNGRVNVRRANEAILEQACGEVLHRRDVGVLLEARRQELDLGVDGLLARLAKIDETQKAKLQAALTDTSACHGVWVIAHGRQRDWYALAVGLGGPAAAARPQADGAKGATDQGSVLITQRYDFAW